MLQKILYTLPLVFVLLVTSVLAQTIPQDPPTPNTNGTKWFNVRLECMPLPKMLENTMEKYGEEALFIGRGLSVALDGTPYTGGTMFLVNQDTGTWSLVTLYQDGTACLTGAGTDFEPFSG
jgi:hypothetical protein